jgi:trehalose 6-phosphate synthase
VRPIAVDPAEFDALKASEGVRAEERVLAEDRPEQLIVRVDRVELSKNVVRGFRAYALMLERHPEHIGRVQMLVLLNPSRESLSEYGEYRAAIEDEAAAVNDRFSVGGLPAVDLRIADNFPLNVAANKQFDVLFVNPIFDGMNLVAKEGPLVNDRAGVVVLSENAGAHAELAPWTVTVNPFDLDGQAEALHRALTMPLEERRRRLNAIAAHVREHDLEAWTQEQLRDLDRVPERVPSRR